MVKVPGKPKRSSGVVVPHAPTWKQRAAAYVVATLMRLLASTLRYTVNGRRGPAELPDEPVIFALWHNRLGLCMKVYESFVRPHAQQDHSLSSFSFSGSHHLTVRSSISASTGHFYSSTSGARELNSLYQFCGCEVQRMGR